MTLIMGIAYKDQFVMMSSDSKVTSQMYKSDYNTTEGDIAEVGQTIQPKVRVLTNNVLIALGGIVETGEAVLAELQEKIQPEDSLQVCSDILTEVIADLWEQRKPQNPLFPQQYRKDASLNFLHTSNFGCYLLGFFENGNAGCVKWNPVKQEVETTEVNTAEAPAVSFIFSPDVQKNTDYISWMNLPAVEQSLENFAEQLALIHGKLSHDDQVSISSDFNLIAIGNEKQQIESCLDTAMLYEMFAEYPEINHKKLWRLPE